MHSGASYRSDPTLMTRPSGSYDATSDEQSRSISPKTCACTHRVVLHEHRRLLAQLLVQLQVIAHEAQRLLDAPHGLEVCGPLERVAPHEQKLDEVSGDVSACDVESAGEVREGKAVVDGDDVCDAVTRVDDYTGLQTCSESDDAFGHQIGNPITISLHSLHAFHPLSTFHSPWA